MTEKEKLADLSIKFVELQEQAAYHQQEYQKTGEFIQKIHQQIIAIRQKIKSVEEVKTATESLEAQVNGQ